MSGRRSLRLVPAVWAIHTLGVLSAAAPAPARAQAPESVVERAQRVHAAVITIDTHADIPFNFGTPEYNACNALNRQVDVPKMRAGGLDAAFFIVYVGQTERTPENYAVARAGAMQKFAGIRRMTTELCPDLIELAYTADDVERIHAAGRLVAAIGIENGFVMGRDLPALAEFHALGGRYMSLTHNGHNDLADSWLADARLGDDGPEHGGLSALGEAVVAEMNRLGIMVDVSHASKATVLDLARVSRAPLIASHSGVRALARTERNMDDEMMLALARTGGVMQTVALGSFVRDTPPDRQAPVTVAEYVDHIDYAARLMGIDHVGISSDFDGGGGVAGWGSAAETFNVTLELVRRGYTEEEIRKLWGGNLLRVWRAAERVAAELQAGN